MRCTCSGGHPVVTVFVLSFALPGMPTRLSPLATTAILAVVITVWHLPLAFLEGGDLRSNVAIIVVGTAAVQHEGLLYMVVWLAVAVVLVVVDLRSWLRPAPVDATWAPDVPTTTARAR